MVNCGNWTVQEPELEWRTWLCLSISEAVLSWRNDFLTPCSGVHHCTYLFLSACGTCRKCIARNAILLTGILSPELWVWTCPSEKEKTDLNPIIPFTLSRRVSGILSWQVTKWCTYTEEWIQYCRGWEHPKWGSEAFPGELNFLGLAVGCFLTCESETLMSISQTSRAPLCQRAVSDRGDSSENLESPLAERVYVCKWTDCSASIGAECSEQVLLLQQVPLPFLLVSRKGGIEAGWERGREKIICYIQVGVRSFWHFPALKLYVSTWTSFGALDNDNCLQVKVEGWRFLKFKNLVKYLTLVKSGKEFISYVCSICLVFCCLVWIHCFITSLFHETGTVTILILQIKTLRQRNVRDVPNASHSWYFKWVVCFLVRGQLWMFRTLFDESLLPGC
jgi:hypothetical protein